MEIYKLRISTAVEQEIHDAYEEFMCEVHKEITSSDANTIHDVAHNLKELLNQFSADADCSINQWATAKCEERMVGYAQMNDNSEVNELPCWLETTSLHSVNSANLCF